MKMNKYLVIYEVDGDLEEPVIHTASQIFHIMEMNNINIISIRHLRQHKTADEFRLDAHCFMPCYIRNDGTKMEIAEMFGENHILDTWKGDQL